MISALLLMALSLSWQPVSLDVDGQPLSAGNEVKSYRVYRCQSNSCSLATATLVATVPAPTTTFNIDSQPKPSSYFVTATNLSGESAESNGVRVTPPGKTVVTVTP